MNEFWQERDVLFNVELRKNVEFKKNRPESGRFIVIVY